MKQRSLKRETLYIPVGTSLCQLIIDHPYYMNYLQKRYYSVSSNQTVSCIIKLKTYKNNLYCINTVPNPLKLDLYLQKHYSLRDVDYIIRALIGYCLLQDNILLLHGSSFHSKGKGYAFLGPSGVGKSTIIKRVQKNNVLSDDTAIIKKVRSKFYIFTSPFDNYHYPNLHQKRVPLEKIYIIKQSTTTKFYSINLIESLNIIQTYDIFSDFISIYMKKNNENSSVSKNNFFSQSKKGPHKYDSSEYILKYFNLILNLVSCTKLEKLYFTRKLTFLPKL